MKAKQLIAPLLAVTLAAGVVAGVYALQQSSQVRVRGNTIFGEILATNVPGHKGELVRYATFKRMQHSDGSLRDEVTYYKPQNLDEVSHTSLLVGIAGKGLFTRVTSAKALRFEGPVPPTVGDLSKLKAVPGVREEDYLGVPVWRYTERDPQGVVQEKWEAPSLGAVVKILTTYPDGTRVEYRTLSIILGEPDRAAVTALPTDENGQPWRVSTGTLENRLRRFEQQGRTGSAERVKGYIEEDRQLQLPVK